MLGTLEMTDKKTAGLENNKDKLSTEYWGLENDK